VPYAFKITAVNEGGESFASEILTAYRAPQKHAPRVLMVNGFTKVSGPETIQVSDSLGFALTEDYGLPYMNSTAFCGEQLCFDTLMAGREGQGALGYSTHELEGQMIAGNTLLLAYNAHFDLSFLFYLLLRDGDPTILKGKDKLDLLTVYKDRRSYPHRLCNAIEAYDLADKVVNSHRAVDDVLATVEVMKAMEAEQDDLMRYVNLFGYNPKYGVEGKPIGSVTYKPQRYDPPQPLYMT
jgi:hypothetical protein